MLLISSETNIHVYIPIYWKTAVNQNSFEIDNQELGQWQSEINKWQINLATIYKLAAIYKCGISTPCLFPVILTTCCSNASHFVNRAVYTCIKNPESFVTFRFFVGSCRQLPLNTAKKPNKKTHLRSGIVFETPRVFQGFFCQCKRLLQSRRVLFGFLVTWYVTFSGITDRGPRRNAPYTCIVKGRLDSRACATTYQNIKVLRFRVFFAHALFECQKTWMLWGFPGKRIVRRCQQKTHT